MIDKITRYLIGTGKCLASIGLVAGMGWLSSSLKLDKTYHAGIANNPVTVEGKIISEKPDGKNLEFLIETKDGKDIVHFESYSMFSGAEEACYKFNWKEKLSKINERVNPGDLVQVDGFKDPKTNKIYGVNVKKPGYVLIE
jgi:hypothetical protein